MIAGQTGSFAGQVDYGVRVVGLRTNDDSGLVASAFAAPVLQWRLEADRDDVVQLGYEVQRAGNPDFTRDLHASGLVDGSFPVVGEWPGAALASRQAVWCRVRVRTDEGVTEWSDALRIEGSLFNADDWVAKPISPDFNVGVVDPAPVPLVRRAFGIAGQVERARLYVSALGMHDLSINGHRVSQALFEPGWTEYGSRLLYATYDVAPFLQPGENVIAAAVGDGWWRGNLTWLPRRAVYGDTTALLAQLEIDYADGRRAIVATDERWRGSTGALIRADLYGGCECDVAREQAGWREAAFDADGWSPVEALPIAAVLEQRSVPAVRVIDAFPVEGEAGEGGITRVDCGQNLTGYLRIAIVSDGEATVTVRHAEVLEADGSPHTAALRTAKATDIYHVPAGRRLLVPSFTYHGFRHAEVVAGPGVRIESVEVCVVSSDLREIGGFRCSDGRLNKLYENIKWSQRGNFVSIPTDCPQRDERLGWTGDIQVFAPTAAANFDVRAFLASWLIDLAHGQAPDGRVPSTIPNVIQWHEYNFGGIGWADAVTLVPWALYEAYDDRATLARQFDSMRGWVDWCASRLNAEDVWLDDFHLGDWLDPGAPTDKPELATTDRDFIASAYLAKSADTLARASSVLARRDLVETYAALRDRVARATWRRWRETAPRTQTGCAMAIEFGVAPPDALPELGLQLAQLVEEAGGRIATGFLGTPLVLPALTRTGQIDAAYKLLLNEEMPGWLYQVRNGATTVWERWDAIKPNGSINMGEMAAEGSSGMMSFNHYAYGSVGAWLYRSLAGIGPDENRPGYEHILFRPQPGGGLAWAEASVETPFGHAAIRWDIAGAELAVEIEIPPGASGTFFAPAGWSAPGDGELSLKSGRHRVLLAAA